MKTPYLNLFIKIHLTKLGDDYQYPIKGVGEASYKLNSDKSMKMKEVLYVLEGIPLMIQ